jgi:hypothetical protein
MFELDLTGPKVDRDAAERPTPATRIRPRSGTDTVVPTPNVSRIGS